VLIYQFYFIEKRFQTAMIVFLKSVHIIVSIALIVIVLLQAGKGADLGATFGTGASQSLFGAGGGSSFLGKLTATAAVIFMLTCLSLAYLSGRPLASSMPASKPAAKTVPQTAAPAKGNPVPAPTLPQQPVKK
jgi:preprotein translocase subunit SecG